MSLQKPLLFWAKLKLRGKKEIGVGVRVQADGLLLYRNLGVATSLNNEIFLQEMKVYLRV